jgi:hypothetical protein
MQKYPDWERLLAAKTAVESRLRQVMARTEKLTASVDRNGMFWDAVSSEAGLQSQDGYFCISPEKVY